jgi:hypothetical protein
MYAPSGLTRDFLRTHIDRGAKSHVRKSWVSCAQGLCSLLLPLAIGIALVAISTSLLVNDAVQGPERGMKLIELFL